MCQECGNTFDIGDWPFCPHGKGAHAIQPDDVPGGFVAENGFEVPTRFYSRKAHQEALAARGLEIRAKWAGPTDRHLKRWDAPSAKTLADAKILLERGTQARHERRERYAIAVRTLKPQEVGR